MPSLEEIFAHEHNFSFVLLLILLAFASFRPDLLIPGGKVLTHFPTLLAGLLLLHWLKVSPKVLDNRQTKLLLIFVALMFIHLLFARNFGYNFRILKGFVIFELTIYLFYVQFVDNFFKLNKYLRLYFVLSLFLVLLGATGAGRVEVPLLRDENDFCLYINMLIPFGYFLAVQAETKAKKIFYYSTLLLFIFGIVASFSRGGFVGFVAVMLYLFWKSQKKMVLLSLVLLMFGTAYFVAPPQYWEEIKTIDTSSPQKGTGRERIESWGAGWRMFLDHPIIGVGPGNYGPWLPDYWNSVDLLDSRKQKDPMRMWGRVAHSLYFTLLSEMGLIGTLLFIGILMGNYRDHRYICALYQKKDEILAGSSLAPEDKNKISNAIDTLYYFSLSFSGAMVAFLATGIFISVLWYKYFWILASFWVAAGNQARNLTASIEEHATTGQIGSDV